MPQNQFPVNVMRGTVGERFVTDHLDALVQKPDLILNLRNRAGEYVEGGDISAHSLVLGDAVENFLPEFAGVIDIGDRTAYEVKDYTIGSFEVKTDWGFLFRPNDNEEPFGTLAFALWADESRKKPGWLLRIMYPDLFYKEGEKIHSVQPMTLFFVLAAYQNAFACIAFENIPALRERIEDIAAEAGFDLRNGVPIGEAAIGWQPEGMLLQDEMWYIQFSKLEDLATVTMIGERPRIRPDIIAAEYRCTSFVQNQRYDHLVKAAGGRAVVSADEKYQDAFVPSERMRVFAFIDKNLDIIENLDPEKYPILTYYSKQKVFSHLEGLMRNMLSHPYPVWPENNPSYFVIGNDYLENWCKDHGIGGSSKSIQGSLMFLRIIGLVKVFRPAANYHDPVVDKIISRIRYDRGGRKISFRTVPYYSEDVLREAEKHAKLYYDKRINISKLSKTDVIHVEGQEAADRYYMSSTTVSNAEAYVDSVCFAVIQEAIETQGYALFADVISEAKKRVYSSLHQWEPEFDTTEDQAQYEQIEKCRKAFRKFEERKRAKAAQQGLIYRQIKNEDREAMNISPDVRSWIFTKK